MRAAEGPGPTALEPEGGSAMPATSTPAIGPYHGLALPPAPPSTPWVAERRGRAAERWGNEGADHHNLTPGYLCHPWPEKRPRADNDCRAERAGPGSSGVGGEVPAMLGGGEPAIRSHGSRDLTPAPAVARPVAESRGGAAGWWGRGTGLSSGFPPRPPSPEKTPPGLIEDGAERAGSAGPELKGAR